MADALDSGSSGSNPVRVQVPFSALNENPGSLVIKVFRDFSLLYISKMGHAEKRDYQRRANSVHSTIDWLS